MIKMAVIGCGYWGPNLIRNAISSTETELLWVCDKDSQRLEKVVRPYPGVQTTNELGVLLEDERLDGVAIATPVNTHYAIVKACLENGKHVLIEKPLAASVEEGEELVAIAEKKNLRLMCDHTFCYTGAVRKIKDIVQIGALGTLLYFDSVRINLGLFQKDINVIWDLAPHDLSILDFLVDIPPLSVSAHGVSHSNNGIENVAYVSLHYERPFISHFHVNWLSPVKIRSTIIGGTEKMLVWNDMDPAEKIKIYDKGIEIREDDSEDKRQLLISYRSGDMFAPKFDQTEALSLVIKEFADCIREQRPALTDGRAGLRVLKILDATSRSIKADGANVRVNL